MVDGGRVSPNAVVDAGDVRVPDVKRRRVGTTRVHRSQIRLGTHEVVATPKVVNE